MACCLLAAEVLGLLLRLIVWPFRAISGRSSVTTVSTPPIGTWSSAEAAPQSLSVDKRLPWKWLTLAAGSEFALGFSLATILLAPMATGENHTEHKHGMVHEGVLVGEPALPTGAALFAIAIGLIILVLASVAVVRHWTAQKRIGLMLPAMALGFLPASWFDDDFAHLLAMVQMEMLVLAVPVLVSPAFAGTRRSRSTSRIGAAGERPLTSPNYLPVLLAASTVPIVMTLWHMPGMRLLTGVAMDVVEPLTLLAAGLLLWIVAARRSTRTTPITGGQALLFSYSLASPVGIAMIVMPYIAMASEATPAMSAMQSIDQQLAGLTMMIAEFIIVLPVLSRWAGAHLRYQLPKSTDHDAGVTI